MRADIAYMPIENHSRKDLSKVKKLLQSVISENLRNALVAFGVGAMMCLSFQGGFHFYHQHQIKEKILDYKSQE